MALLVANWDYGSLESGVRFDNRTLFFHDGAIADNLEKFLSSYVLWHDSKDGLICRAVQTIHGEEEVLRIEIEAPNGWVIYDVRPRNETAQNYVFNGIRPAYAPQGFILSFLNFRPECVQGSLMRREMVGEDFKTRYDIVIGRH